MNNLWNGTGNTHLLICIPLLDWGTSLSRNLDFDFVLLINRWQARKGTQKWRWVGESIALEPGCPNVFVGVWVQ